MANICYTKFKVEGSEKEVEALRKALNKREGKKLASYLRYCRLAPLTEASVQKLPHGGEVLSFETATNWGPELREWTCIIRACAPHVQVVYYAEEFGQRDHETNDIWGKYFRAPYAVYAHISDKTPEALRKAFTVLRKFRLKYPGVKVYDADDMSFTTDVIRNAELILINVTHMSHKQYAPVIKAIRQYHKNVEYIK